MTEEIHDAKVIGTDPRTDLALIKVDDAPFPYVKVSDKAPRIGDRVLAVGNPFGLGGNRHRRHRIGARPRHRRQRP